MREALSEHESVDRAAVKGELAEAVKGAEELGLAPEAVPKVQQLQAKLATTVPVNTLVSEVYDHLYAFFRRYYSEGDFISRRVYKPGVYAIPYEGEEVKLHWANADQYYTNQDRRVPARLRFPIAAQEPR